MSERLVIEDCAIATVDGAGSEHVSGHIVIDGGVIVEIGEGHAPAGETARRIEGEGLLATPGLVVGQTETAAGAVASPGPSTVTCTGATTPTPWVFTAATVSV